ncbi:hypothetical protein [Rurimicrobium arvi]|uniref:Secreted protein n=1 Tax=Rurimicrobium arvi TaxID=2049916 RepID=A0ABP8MUK3_9BACT
MKKIILFLALALSIQDLSAQNSTESVRRRKRLSKRSAGTQPNTADTFRSRNGKMNAHTITKDEEEAREKEKINATQVNHGINENMPPLSPSNGNGQ